MTANVRAVIDRVLLHEGGIADVGDGKGLTRFGQTPQWLDQWGLAAPRTVDEAAENYAIWLDKIGLAAVCEIDPILGSAVVDFAVNSGHVTAVKALQRAIGVAADGVIGGQTVAALSAVKDDARQHVTLLVHCTRLEFIGRIITDELTKLRGEGRLKSDKKTHGEYAAGWLNRMAANLRADLV